MPVPLSRGPLPTRLARRKSARRHQSSELRVLQWMAACAALEPARAFTTPFSAANYPTYGLIKMVVPWQREVSQLTEDAVYPVRAGIPRAAWLGLQGRAKRHAECQHERGATSV